MEQQSTKSKNYLIIIYLFVFVFILYTGIFIWRVSKKTSYIMVMINPAHGGKTATASKIDGDRYDPILKRYTVDYKGGIETEKLSEYQILFQLAKKIEARLIDTRTIWKWRKFEKLLKKYGKKKKYDRFVIDPELIKKEDYHYYEKKGKKDVNKYFRLFDFPSRNIFKKMENGLLSYINKYKPEILLNLDFSDNKDDDDVIFTISVPDYHFFNTIRKSLIEKNLVFNQYLEIINKWYGKSFLEKRNKIIEDTWIYFTGYKPDKSSFNASEEFLGLGYNLVTWNRNDDNYVENYLNKDQYPQYNSDLKTFQPKGMYWEREQNKAEQYKRTKGDHQKGDNVYINEEILNSIFNVLLLCEKNYIKSIKKDFVFQYDAKALYLNSFVVNIKFGSLNNKYIRRLFTEDLDALADAICVGLYSIGQGYDLKTISSKYPVKGEPIDFKKYYKMKYLGRNRKYQ